MPIKYRRRSSHTLLVTYLSVSHLEDAQKTLPLLEASRRKKALNSMRHSKDNNDLLEFIGDRVVNLACTLLVDKVKISADHHLVVGRMVSNNDTLGRVAYHLRLAEQAQLDTTDYCVKNWTPQDTYSPPKGLADLFESYVGAIYEEHGFDVAMRWLEPVFTPLIEAATEDFMASDDPDKKYDHWLIHQDIPEHSSQQDMLLDYFNYKCTFFSEKAQEALDFLPPSTGRSRLPSYTILGMQNIRADLSGASTRDIEGSTPRFGIRITTLATSDWSLGYLGSLLGLTTFFEQSDVDCNSTRRPIPSRDLCSRPDVRPQEVAYRRKLSFALKATVGWFHHRDAVAANKWANVYFRNIVIRSHDIIIQDSFYVPNIPKTAKDTLSLHAAAVAAASSRRCSSDAVSCVTGAVEKLDISSDTHSSNSRRGSSLRSVTSNESSDEGSDADRPNEKGSQTEDLDSQGLANKLQGLSCSQPVSRPGSAGKDVTKNNRDGGASSDKKSSSSGGPSCKEAVTEKPLTSGSKDTPTVAADTTGPRQTSNKDTLPRQKVVTAQSQLSSSIPVYTGARTSQTASADAHKSKKNPDIDEADKADPPFKSGNRPVNWKWVIEAIAAGATSSTQPQSTFVIESKICQMNEAYGKSNTRGHEGSRETRSNLLSKPVSKAMSHFPTYEDTHALSSRL
ncbi:hypothetical protein AMATHDRAFT_3268 [Amanita thiersii Skay4041]|uniref:RNase III domain-containing protein n=1 Tax=Amanita thiersii Skay4041 TaxID=703135 RepID=A0A2A9NS36_9AGAR|nr:hypothetical protein AMATHDRAFT_3268 [Amanita thiersii Skay4041]